MNFFLVLPYYFVWHYSRAYHDIKSVWKNFLVFVYHFFSIPTLLRTLFSPWQRIQDSFSPRTSIFETLIFNTIMRLIGVVVRLTFIIIGLAVLILALLLGVAFFFVWLFVPFILLGAVLWGISELFI